jgi:hypothetical protein
VSDVVEKLCFGVQKLWGDFPLFIENLSEPPDRIPRIHHDVVAPGKTNAKGAQKIGKKDCQRR